MADSSEVSRSTRRTANRPGERAPPRPSHHRAPAVAGRPDRAPPHARDRDGGRPAPLSARIRGPARARRARHRPRGRGQGERPSARALRRVPHRRPDRQRPSLGASRNRAPSNGRERDPPLPRRRLSWIPYRRHDPGLRGSLCGAARRRASLGTFDGGGAGVAGGSRDRPSNRFVVHRGARSRGRLGFPPRRGPVPGRGGPEGDRHRPRSACPGGQRLGVGGARGPRRVRDHAGDRRDRGRLRGGRPRGERPPRRGQGGDHHAGPLPDPGRRDLAPARHQRRNEAPGRLPGSGDRTVVPTRRDRARRVPGVRRGAHRRLRPQPLHRALARAARAALRPRGHADPGGFAGPDPALRPHPGSGARRRGRRARNRPRPRGGMAPRGVAGAGPFPFPR